MEINQDQTARPRGIPIDCIHPCYKGSQGSARGLKERKIGIDEHGRDLSTNKDEDQK
jgi:hypothetical protein